MEKWKKAISSCAIRINSKSGTLLLTGRRPRESIAKDIAEGTAAMLHYLEDLKQWRTRVPQADFGYRIATTGHFNTRIYILSRARRMASRPSIRLYFCYFAHTFFLNPSCYTILKKLKDMARFPYLVSFLFLSHQYAKGLVVPSPQIISPSLSDSANLDGYDNSRRAS